MVELLTSELARIKDFGSTLKISDLVASKRNTIGKGSKYHEEKANLLAQLKSDILAADEKKSIREQIRTMSMLAAELRVTINTILQTRRSTRVLSRSENKQMQIDKLTAKIDKLQEKREKLINDLNAKVNA